MISVDKKLIPEEKKMNVHSATCCQPTATAHPCGGGKGRRVNGGMAL